MIEIKLNLASFLTNEMSKSKISLSKLSEDICLPKSVLHSWTNGTPPTLNEKNLQYLEKIACYFNTTIPQLILNDKSDKKIPELLFDSIFRDGAHRYRIRIEKIKD